MSSYCKNLEARVARLEKLSSAKKGYSLVAVVRFSQKNRDHRKDISFHSDEKPLYIGKKKDFTDRWEVEKVFGSSSVSSSILTQVKKLQREAVVFFNEGTDPKGGLPRKQSPNKYKWFISETHSRNDKLSLEYAPKDARESAFFYRPMIHIYVLDTRGRQVKSAWVIKTLRGLFRLTSLI
jgi:hypothetical protein